MAGGYTSESEQEMRQSRTFTKRGDLWRHGDLVVVPEVYELRRRCIAINHDLPSAGHPGRNITLELVQRHFWWAFDRRDVNRLVASCVSCQSNKTRRLNPLDYPVQGLGFRVKT
jgi:hypothetical protein